MRVLIVDDEKIKRVTLADDLAAQGYEVETAADGEEALERLRDRHFDVVVADVKMPRVDGLELLRYIKQGEQAPATDVIMMTAYGSIQLAVESMKLGAYDFITKPFRNEDLFPVLARLQKERGRRISSREVEGPKANDIESSVIGQSAVMTRVKKMIEICTRTDANVLLCGETGVGKDLIAQVIHRNSHRAQQPFVKVGCTLFPAHLIESELYGHEKGAFTGADQRRPGRFEIAQGGTLYLDDVDDIPLEQQAKLLRVIEEKVFERVGGTTPIQADVRIIASTKQNLLEKTAQGTFRQDLYYRLDVLRINIPPLRERREDIPLLAEHFMKKIAGDQPYKIDPAAIQVLQEHEWPGNIRELYHTLERAYLMGSGNITADVVRAEMAYFPIKDMKGTAAKLMPSTFQDAINQAERELLEKALREAGGNKTAAAAALGMKPSTFRDKLAKHGLG
ncbi:MAG TPA: sigma-54 dependent transcriptional regulator [Thermogutta sp.]|nr:sigma-54 dependent transcriptional regulator [Thermogutta sp.]HOP77483.1 sigma-54 dependent transcriptional regulator [Thermogutta sp.]